MKIMMSLLTRILPGLHVEYYASKTEVKCLLENAHLSQFLRVDSYNNENRPRKPLTILGRHELPGARFPAMEVQNPHPRPLLAHLGVRLFF